MKWTGQALHACIRCPRMHATATGARGSLTVSPAQLVGGVVEAVVGDEAPGQRTHAHRHAAAVVGGDVDGDVHLLTLRVVGCGVGPSREDW